MLRRAAAAIDGFDIVIAGGLSALFAGVTGRYDVFMALIVVGFALLLLAAIGLWTSR